MLRLPRTFHSLRYSTSVLMQRRGYHPRLIEATLGHGSLELTYGVLRRLDTRDARRRRRRASQRRDVATIAGTGRVVPPVWSGSPRRGLPGPSLSLKKVFRDWSLTEDRAGVVGNACGLGVTFVRRSDAASNCPPLHSRPGHGCAGRRCMRTRIAGTLIGSAMPTKRRLRCRRTSPS